MIVPKFSVVFCLVVLKSALIDCVTIDNDIASDPIIECMDDKIRFWTQTRKYFAGRIYAKGRADNQACIKADFAALKTREPHFDMSFGYCGMQTLRSLDPRGMFYSITVMVSFHPLFITKVDKAFHVKCFFEEANAGLTAEIGVSMVPTTEVTAAHATPGCKYSIHRATVEELDGGYDVGPAIQFARVGDKVMHRWQCDDKMFGILINNCYVTDGFGQRADVVDARGCPVDPILITGIRYTADLTTAYAESHVFKFADKPGVWFFCQLQMCMMGAGMCEGITPPSCGSNAAAPSSGGYGAPAPAPSYPSPSSGYPAPVPAAAPSPSYSSSHGPAPVPAPGYSSSHGPAPAASYPSPPPSYPSQTSIPYPSPPPPVPYPAPAASPYPTPSPYPAPAPYPVPPPHPSPSPSPAPAPSYASPSHTPPSSGYGGQSAEPLLYAPPTHPPYPPYKPNGGYTIETGPVEQLHTAPYPQSPYEAPSDQRSPYDEIHYEVPAPPPAQIGGGYYESPAVEAKIPGQSLGELTVIYESNQQIPVVYDNGDVSGVGLMPGAGYLLKDNNQKPKSTKEKPMKEKPNDVKNEIKPEIDHKHFFKEHTFNLRSPTESNAAKDNAASLINRRRNKSREMDVDEGMVNMDMYRTTPAPKPKLPKPRIRIYPPARLPSPKQDELKIMEKKNKKKRPDPQPRLFFNRLTNEALTERGIDSSRFEKSYRNDDVFLHDSDISRMRSERSHETESQPEPHAERHTFVDYEGAEFDTNINADQELMGQLIVYDLDEDPPSNLQLSKQGFGDFGLGPTIVEEDVEAHSNSTNQCIITSQGLLTLLSLSGSVTGVLSFILFVTCVRLQKNDKMSRLQAAYGHKIRDMDAIEQCNKHRSNSKSNRKSRRTPSNVLEDRGPPPGYKR